MISKFEKSIIFFKFNNRDSWILVHQVNERIWTLHHRIHEKHVGRGHTDTHRLMFVGNQKRQHHSCLNSYPSNSVEDACLSWIDDILYKLNVSSTAFTCLLSISLRKRILLFVLNAYNVKNMPFFISCPKVCGRYSLSLSKYFH